MLASGNGDMRVCALNLLRTIRGEVPLVRTKGIAREHIDAPATQSHSLRADAERVLEIFEPRLESSDVEVMADNAIEGSYDLEATIK